MIELENNTSLRVLIGKIRKQVNRIGAIGLHDVDDLVQITLIRLLKTKHPKLPSSAWLNKVVRNVAYSAHRENTERLKQIAPLHVSTEDNYWVSESSNDDPRETATTVEACRRFLISQEEPQYQISTMKNAFEKLSADQQELLLLCVADFPYFEIAQRISIPVNTVRSRIHYARKRAQKFLVELQ